MTNSFDKITIKSDHRVFTAGKTGTGKTFLNMNLLLPVHRLIVWDSKEDLTEWNTEDFDIKRSFKRLHDDQYRIRVVLEEDFLALCKELFNIGNGIVFIDEVGNLRNDKEDIVRDIWQRGRARDIGGWAISQRPKDLPMYFFSDVEHFFCFKLNLLNDRKRMGEPMGEPVVKKKIVDRFGFWYYNNLTDSLTYYKSLRMK